MAKEKPQALQGMRDFLPEAMIARQHVIDVARRVYESCGFEPLDTPCVEYADVLMGKYGPEADKLIYNFEDRGGRHVGLRYDLTVPLARVVACHGDLPRPFKRYQIGPVWRAERPQKGRYREFTQCDVDIVGASPPGADAEIVAAFFGVYRALGLHDVVIRLNHREILAAMGRAAGIPDEHRTDAFRSIDKLDKMPRETVQSEMVELGIDPAAADRLLDTVLSQGPLSSLETLRDRIAGDERGLEGLGQMEEISRLLLAMGVPASNFRLDLSLARGLDYYTGMTLEAMLPEMRGSVGGGGRYDNLVGMFGSLAVPTVGASVGLDRIIDVLAERGKLPGTRTVTRVLVTVFSPEMRRESIALASSIRQAGIPTETYLLDKPLGKQFQYADQKGVPFAVVIGPDEMQKGVVTLRDLSQRDQETLTRDELIERINQRLSS